MMKLKHGWVIALAAVLLWLGCENPANDDPPAPPPPNVESEQPAPQDLTRREAIAVQTAAGVFLSWRLYLNDYADIGFNVLKDGQKINAEVLGPAYTDYTDAGGTAGNRYQIEVISGGETVFTTADIPVWTSNYRGIPLQKPGDGYVVSSHPAPGCDSNDPEVVKTPYTAYDAADGVAADLDGDGELEIVFFWTPENRKDNSESGRTAVVFIDAYKLDGTKLWGDGKYISVGPNIRAGNHYDTMVMYDFDGDGKAEIALKTAPGTLDTAGHNVALDIDPEEADKLFLDTGSAGKVRHGPEYLSVFEGATGRVIDTVYYLPPRGHDEAEGSIGRTWGDTSMNRADRHLSCAAHLGGVTANASIIMCRGYYARTALAAWNLVNKKLALRWYFDTRSEPSAPNSFAWGSQYESQGNHNLSVADVDGDGYDEIVYGAMAIDHNGLPLYATGLGHGDAMHVGDLDPTRPGLEVVDVHESGQYGIEMHDAATGAILWRHTGTGDTGRGVCADIDPDYPGEESWATGQCPGVFTATDGAIIRSSGFSSNNMVIYWDGDTGRELFDGGYEETAAVQKITKTGSTYTVSTLSSFTGCKTNGGTKRNPTLQVDLFGDWREEVILRTADNSELRIFTTTIPTVHEGPGAIPSRGIPTLLDNHQYRMAIVWQNTAYNQPPHTSWFIGYNMAEIRQ
jgi:hypothetical protein